MNENYLTRGKTHPLREIPTGAWITGWYYENEYGDPRIQDIEDDEEYNIDPATVGQCTGLRDKNGTLIFEGDIVKLCDTNPILFVVSIEMKKYGWACEFRYADDGKIVKGAFLHRCEVIGNIHDNPELLKGA